MSITEELRRYADKFGESFDRDGLLGIADRIDEAHGKMLAEQRKKGFDDGVNSTLMWDDDGWLAEHGLVRLPVDADGKPWMPGDAISSNYRGECINWLSYHGGGHWEYDATHSEGPIEYAKRPNSPAERIRRICDGLVDWTSDGSSMISREDRNELSAIADELEGEGE